MCDLLRTLRLMMFVLPDVFPIGTHFSQFLFKLDHQEFGISRPKWKVSPHPFVSKSLWMQSLQIPKSRMTDRSDAVPGGHILVFHLTREIREPGSSPFLLGGATVSDVGL